MDAFSRYPTCEVLLEGDETIAGDDAFSSAEVVQMQVYLRQLGFLSIERIGGIVGPSTRAAIGAYEQSQGWPTSGNYTYDLLQALEQDATGAVRAASQNSETPRTSAKPGLNRSARVKKPARVKRPKPASNQNVAPVKSTVKQDPPRTTAANTAPAAEPEPAKTAKTRSTTNLELGGGGGGGGSW